MATGKLEQFEEKIPQALHGRSARHFDYVYIWLRKLYSAFFTGPGFTAIVHTMQRSFSLC